MLDNLNNTTTAARGLRLGVAGPVGTGKSTLIATICRELRVGVRDRGGHQRHLH